MAHVTGLGRKAPFSCGESGKSSSRNNQVVCLRRSRLVITQSNGRLSADTLYCWKHMRQSKRIYRAMTYMQVCSNPCRSSKARSRRQKLKQQQASSAPMTICPRFRRRFYWTRLKHAWYLMSEKICKQGHVAELITHSMNEDSSQMPKLEFINLTKLLISLEYQACLVCRPHRLLLRDPGPQQPSLTPTMSPPQPSS